MSDLPLTPHPDYVRVELRVVMPDGTAHYQRYAHQRVSARELMWSGLHAAEAIVEELRIKGVEVAP